MVGRTRQEEGQIDLRSGALKLYVHHPGKDPSGMAGLWLL
jgi:hypothetical protein